MGEPGVDEGGVRKEFFQILVKKLFDPSYGMFTYNEKQRLYWFSGVDIGVAPVQFELVGTLLGLAINNNILIDVPFPMAVYKTLLDQKPDMEDLEEWQPDIAESMKFLLGYKEETPLKDALQLNFTIQVDEWGAKTDVPLKPEGEHFDVTEENVHEYVDLYIDFLFAKQGDW